MSLWRRAIEDTVKKTKENIGRFGKQFPHVSDKGRYLLNDNTDWTDGFWSGILWLSYEYSKDEAFRDAAVKTVDSFKNRLETMTQLDHHDIGFLYSLSSKAQWMVEKDQSARELTLAAADVLLKRWRPDAGLFQAWGPEGDPENGGRIIIDCLMNMPLLYWAYEQTGNDDYRNKAVLHTEKSRRFLVRGDDSSYHTFWFNQENGESIRGGTQQGNTDGSTWTRGQSWGVYGFALAYHYTNDKKHLETSRRMAKYFLEHLPEDNVAYWDFDVEITPETKRDSSASAITACGILELLKHLPDNDPDREYLQEGVQKTMEGLVKHYSTMNQPDAEGFIEHGSYAVRMGYSPDDFMIWGDYYYLEALMRLEKDHKGYWYE